MQMGVEVHLHRVGLPGRCAPRTRCDRSSAIWTSSGDSSFRTPVRTCTTLHLSTDSSSRECTPPNPLLVDDSSMCCRGGSVMIYSHCISAGYSAGKERTHHVPVPPALSA
jgi:hypothetical protein